MPVSAEAADLLVQIRDLRVRGRQRYEDDLVSIDGAYDAQIERIRRAGAKLAFLSLLVMTTGLAVLIGFICH